ncbi:conserved hypothetical protein [Thermotomaculum hydrothermale]|uniref:Uncharacterized protein n=1 Tax=Thermotomaculum hydrothermale TaxID=981385 RepID=A0A7R6PGY9_9BACT|nr:DUF6765 family protein [Thermotomaculum hydrothermale]BBB33544.1 conserved hypothetical protein [Thermotomaculum hydrothermale]
MNIEFHYYSVYIIARKAGFDEDSSYILAYSSQYTDDNCEKCRVNIKEGEEYKNYISQTMDILKPKKELMRIYPCFHFFPGDYDNNSTMRKDGKLHLLNTTPNSKNVKTLLEKALETKNLYRIGIALHTYADSFAHQNFVGYYDCFNGMKGVIERMLPNIGHADAKTNPDIPGKVWKDKRLISKNEEVHNTERFLNAVEKIFDYLWNFKNKNLKGNLKEKAKKETIETLKKCYYKEFRHGDYYKKKRMKLYFQYGQMPEYSKNEWISKALKTPSIETEIPSTIPVTTFFCENRENFFNSHWYKFQQAVKEHQQTALEILEPVFKKIELDPETF